MAKHPYDRFALYEFLKTIVDKRDNGLCAYTGDWNDSKVARKYGVHRLTVVRIRESQFGKLENWLRRKPDDSDPSANIEARLAVIEDHLTELRARIAEITPRRLARKQKAKKA